MLVSEAVAARRSVRQFTDQPVPNDTIGDLLLSSTAGAVSSALVLFFTRRSPS